MGAKSLSELREQEKEARRRLIIEAAERIFSDKPFNKVSIRDIAREAGISHALIYHYFPDQQALFVEAFYKGAQEIVKLVKTELDGGSDIEKVTEKFISYLVEHDQYFRMMTYFMLDGDLSGGFLDRLNGMERLLFDQLERLFNGRDSGKEARLFAHALFAAMNGLLITFRNYPGRNREEVTRHMQNLGQIIARQFSTTKKGTPPRKRRNPGTRG